MFIKIIKSTLLFLTFLAVFVISGNLSREYGSMIGSFIVVTGLSVWQMISKDQK